MEKQPDGKEEISLKELLQTTKEWYLYLLSKWKIIVLYGAIGGGLGITYSLVNKPLYVATLTFALEDDNSSSGGLGSLATSFGIDFGGGGGGVFTGSNLIELFKSRTMVEQTLMSPVVQNGKAISLAEMYIQNNKFRQSWSDKPLLKNIEFKSGTERKYFTRVHDSIMGVIYQSLSQNSLSVGLKDKKTAIISINVTSNNELFSFYFCEALASQVGEFYVDTKSKKARLNMEILERQTDSIRRELNSAITGVAVANDNTFMLNPALNVRRAPSSRRQVDVQANTAILTELVKQTELAKVTLRKETPLIQVIDHPILPLPKERFGKAKGLIIGGFLLGFLTVLYLIVRRLVKDLTM